eukprot:PhM_4_TR16176/c0_g1_i1/m.81439/K10751/CHAF1B; chromatin assembly factor 1 subunit B
MSTPSPSPSQAAASNPTATMRTLELRWHYPHDIASNMDNRLVGADSTEEGPVLSVDWHPSDATRFITSGFDGAVKVWAYDPSPSVPDISAVSHVSSMFLDERSPCNCARWSPTGVVIAAGYDDGNVVLWRRSEDACTPTYEYNLESWAQLHTFRQHKQEVYTLAFSSDSRFLTTGSFDGSIVVYDLSVPGFPRAYTSHTHEHHIQGCVWDPVGTYLVSIGADRKVVVTSCAIDGGNGVFATHDIISHADKGGWLFRGDGASAYYRHGSFSPDGTMLALPCGWLGASALAEAGAPESANNCCHVFLRHVYHRPYRALCVHGDASVLGAKFSPVPYDAASLHPDGVVAASDGNWGPTEYALALAVFTSDVVSVFTTATPRPLVKFADMHMAPISDVSWCIDGARFLIASSDGTCTLCKLTAMRPLAAWGQALAAGDDDNDSAGAVSPLVQLIANTILRPVQQRLTAIRPQILHNLQAIDAARAQRTTLAPRRKKRDRDDNASTTTTTTTLSPSAAVIPDVAPTPPSSAVLSSEAAASAPSQASPSTNREDSAEPNETKPN